MNSGTMRDRHVRGGLGGAMLVVLAVVLGASASPSAAAFPPGANGLIVFESERAGDRDIWAMGPDGSNPINLTPVGANADQLPALSPDGTRIAYNRLDTTVMGDDNDLFLMGTDGSFSANLTDTDSTGELAPTFSPDGTKIALSANTDDAGEILVMGGDGSPPVNVTPGASDGFDSAPNYSPDGTKIAFTSDRDAGDTDVWVMDSDGSNPITRTSAGTALDVAPAFSPDGTKIAFASDREGGGDLDIWVMNANGASQTNLTPGNADIDSQPAFSPDGTKIAFASTRDGTFDIFVMNADGSGTPVNLTPGVIALDGAPDWQRLDPTPIQPPPPDGGGAADTGAPDTTITKGPKAKTKKKSATFEFGGTDARALAGFECKLDESAFAACTSPHTIKVKKGKHSFQVRSTDAAGNADPTPATQSWTVKKKKQK
jgi:Tol biopolymer transport system component